MRRLAIGAVVLLATAAAQAAGPAANAGERRFPAVEQSGVPVKFEAWSWGEDPATRKKIVSLKDGMRVKPDKLLSGMQLQFQIPTAYDEVTCGAYLPDDPKKYGWGPERIDRKESASKIFRIGGDTLVPDPGKYYFEATARNHGSVVAKQSIVFEILPFRKRPYDGLLSVGSFRKLPEAMKSGAPISIQLCKWDGQGANIAAKKLLLDLKDGMTIPWQSLPTSGEAGFRFRVGAAHDTIRCEALSSEAFDRFGWGPEKIGDGGPSPERFYQFGPGGFPLPMPIGEYSIEVEGIHGGRSVAKTIIRFTVVDGSTPPQNTHFLKGKKDCVGNPITWSKPVDLTKLNETPKLQDNDYPFEPQHAYNTVNFERFPAFSLPPRFILVWGTRRFTDEAKIGGPLNRGFTAMASSLPGQDNLTTRQRNYFHTEGLQKMIIGDWYKKNPKKYQDLMDYIGDSRSLFISPENAFELGRASYGNNAATYGWDEEWIGEGFAMEIYKKHPEMLPEDLRELKKKDPEGKKPETLQAVLDAYNRAWGDFIGYGYRGARAAAKERGRTIKVWHYGSKSPNTSLFRPWDDVKPDAAGKYKYEEVARLPSWFKTGNKLNFYASEYSRQIDYFSHDFYYWNVTPEYASMYEKDARGNYVLDKNGRRKARRDTMEEKMYVKPQKFTDEDYDCTPIFFKSFIAKGENCQYFQNGAKYYKQHGTCITDKQLIPFFRIRNQETGFGKSVQLGSRPVSPYYAEAVTIFTFMMGIEGLYYWDAGPAPGPQGFGPPNDPKQYWTFGEIEFVIKGLHRVSQFKNLFEGDYYYIRPVRHYDTCGDHDNPVIRGILKDRYLVLAMTQPYLDPGETQVVEVRYGAPFGKKAVWSDKVTINARKTQVFHCKLPELRNGEEYDPDRLYFRYTCVDGNYKKTYMVTGNYDVTYEKSISTPRKKTVAKAQTHETRKAKSSFFSSETTSSGPGKGE